MYAHKFVAINDLDIYHTFTTVLAKVKTLRPLNSSQTSRHPRQNSMATSGAQPHGIENASEPMSARDNDISGVDIEKQSSQPPPTKEQSSAFKALGWLDRLLALWIFLAMVIGILLGNFVPSTGPALQKGKFVGVSIPIGTVSLSY